MITSLSFFFFFFSLPRKVHQHQHTLGNLSMASSMQLRPRRGDVLVYITLLVNVLTTSAFWCVLHITSACSDSFQGDALHSVIPMHFIQTVSKAMQITQTTLHGFQSDSCQGDAHYTNSFHPLHSDSPQVFHSDSFQGKCASSR